MNYDNLSPEKLEQINAYCGIPARADVLGGILSNPSLDLNQTAAMLWTTPGHLQAALDLPVPDRSTTTSADVTPQPTEGI